MASVDFVRIFDTTLRDGEQSPGATMSTEEKVIIARRLAQLGVGVIEAGFPASSPGEFDAVRRIAESVCGPCVAALCRTRDEDVDRAWRAVSDAERPYLHVFIATSDIHLEHKLRMTRPQVLEEIRRGVAACRSLCPEVEFSAEDATRTDVGFLREAFACAIENGATVVNVPDTVGYTIPAEFEEIVTAVREVVGGRSVIISAHCHDDLGLAVANSLAAVKAGARQVECCINGIGERAGNAALEEVVAALKVRSDVLGVATRVNMRELTGVSRLVSDITGLPVQPNKAVVGRNAFAHEAGIHQHGILHDQRTYEIMRPEDVGLADSKLVLGKHSGRLALRDRLASLGYVLDDAQVEVVFAAFKRLCDKKKNVFDGDLHAIVASEVYSMEAPYHLESIEFKSGSHVTPTASVTLAVGGEARTAESPGDGPINAAIEAIKTCAGRSEVVLEEFHLDAVTGGSDALGQVRLSVSGDGQTFHGRAAHTDVVVASAMAFVDALNHKAYRDEMGRRQGNGAPAKG